MNDLTREDRRKSFETDIKEAYQPPGMQYVRNPSDHSVLTDTNGQPVSVGRILATKPLRHELSTRPGPGNRKMIYLAGDAVARSLNDIFGYNGWNMDILKTELVHKESHNGKHFVAYSAHVRITIVGHCHREDYGSGDATDKSLAGALGNALKASITDGMKRAARLLGEKLGNSLYQENFNIHKAPTTLSAALTSYDQERVRTKFPETKKPPATTKTTSTPSTATAAAGTSSVTGATKPAANSYTPAPPLAVDTSNIPVQHTNMPPPLVTPSAAIPSNTSPYNIPPPMPSEALLGGLFRPESAHGSRKMPSDTPHPHKRLKPANPYG